MKILILGAGAIGSFVGARLSCVCDVFLFSRNKVHIKSILKGGLRIRELDGSERKFFLNGASDYKELDFNPDLVLVSVKTYDTELAVLSAKKVLKGDPYFLTLQNGVGNVEKISKFVNPDKILAGTTSLGSALIEPGYIKHGGDGPTYIGRVKKGEDDFVFKVVEVFNRAGLKTEYVEDVDTYIWKKLLINVGINAITAIAGVKNRWIFENQHAREISRAAVEEAIDVANARGFKFGDEMIEAVFEVSKATSENISSMWQDVLRGRRTEIDAINGAIVRLGAELNILTPVNKTLTNLVKLIESKSKMV